MPGGKTALVALGVVGGAVALYLLTRKVEAAPAPAPGEVPVLTPVIISPEEVVVEVPSTELVIGPPPPDMSPGSVYPIPGQAFGPTPSGWMKLEYSNGSYGWSFVGTLLPDGTVSYALVPPPPEAGIS